LSDSKEGRVRNLGAGGWSRALERRVSNGKHGSESKGRRDDTGRKKKIGQKEIRS
jgi:hypothetical protein